MTTSEVSWVFTSDVVVGWTQDKEANYMVE